MVDKLHRAFNNAPEAVAFLRKHLNVRSEIRGVDRKDIYELPLAAIREAVLNALMHRDYSITGTQASLEIYDDRVFLRNIHHQKTWMSLRNPLWPLPGRCPEEGSSTS